MFQYEGKSRIFTFEKKTWLKKKKLQGSFYRNLKTVHMLNFTYEMGGRGRGGMDWVKWHSLQFSILTIKKA